MMKITGQQICSMFMGIQNTVEIAMASPNRDSIRISFQFILMGLGTTNVEVLGRVPSPAIGFSVIRLRIGGLSLWVMIWILPQLVWVGPTVGGQSRNKSALGYCQTQGF